MEYSEFSDLEEQHQCYTSGGDEDEDTESGAQRLDCARSSHHSSFKSKQGANADDWEDVKNQILLSHKECPQDPKQTSSVREIYKELNAINQKLKRESQILHERELRVREKEKTFETIEQYLSQSATQVNAQIEDARNAEEREAELRASLKVKTQEINRLRDNFQTMKTINDSLRKELEDLQTEHAKVLKQNDSLGARLINLQRKLEYQENKTHPLPASAPDLSLKKASKPVALKAKPASMTQDLLFDLMKWVSDEKLHQSSANRPCLSERCMKMIPWVHEVLQDVSKKSSSDDHILASLHFLYQCLHILTPQQRSSMISTLRRIGEELYSCKAPSSEDSVVKGCDDLKRGKFLRHKNLQIRILSYLIILLSLSQVDKVAYVFELLRNEVKDPKGKEVFLQYDANNVLLTHLKPSNKVLCSAVVDVYLQMSVDGPCSSAFLQSCCEASWFQSIALLWTLPSTPQKLLEKISILLQKISKVKGAKKWFDGHGLILSCQEMAKGSAKDNSFLLLNIKSILFNFNI